MDNIKTSGDFIAVKVPVGSHAFELQSDDMKTCYLYYWIGTMDYENRKVNVPFLSEIIGLISDIVTRHEVTWGIMMPDHTPKEIDQAWKFFQSIPKFEWHLWLTIKKTK